MDNQAEEWGNGVPQDVGRLINTISHQLKRQMWVPHVIDIQVHMIRAEEENDSLTNMQRHILHYILFQSLKKEIYQKDVEQEFQIRRSTATGTLQLLEKNGFITREAVEWDARLKKITPTSKAEGVRERILENIRYMEELLVWDIDPEKLKICLEVLEKMSLNLSQNEKPSDEQRNAGTETDAGGKASEDLSGNYNNKEKGEENKDHE